MKKTKRKITRILRENRKAILRSSLLLLIVAVIAVSAYLIMRACGLNDMEAVRESLGDRPLTYIAIAVLQAIQVVFIPLSNQIITVPACLVFSDQLWKVFLASWAGIIAGSMALWLIGRYGGKKIIGWVLSDKGKADKCSEWLRKGSWIYPVGMLIPFLPDDILTTLAGVGRYGFWYTLVVVTATRGVCTACSVWGFGYLTRFWWGWIVLAVGIALLALATFCLYKANSRKEPNITHYK